MNDSLHARRGILTTAASQASKFLIQTLSTILLARILVPHDFGLFAMVIAITGFASLIGDFGLSTAAIQAKTLSAQQRTNLFWLSGAVGIVLCGVFNLLATPIASFYGEDEISSIVRIVSINFVISGFSSQFIAHVTRELKFGWLAISDILSQALALAIAVSLAVAGFGVWSLVSQQLVIALVAFSVCAIAARWLPGLPRRAPMRGLLSFGFSSFGVQALTYLSSNVDSVVLGRVSGSVQLGIYDQAYRLFKVPVQQIAAPLTRVALPLFSRAQTELGRLSKLVRAAQAAMTLILGGIFVTAAALAEPLIRVVIGDKWAESIPLFTILALGGVFQSMGYVYYWTFLALGMAREQLKWSLVTRSVMIIAVVFSAYWGALGVAIAVAASLGFNWLVLTIFPLRKSGLDVDAIVGSALRAFIVHLFCGALIFFADRTMSHFEIGYFGRLLFGLLVAIALYGAIIFLVKNVRTDLRPVLSVILKPRSKG